MAPQAVVLIEYNKRSRLYITSSIRKFTTDFTADITVSASFVRKASSDMNAICQPIIHQRFLSQKPLSLLHGFIWYLPSSVIETCPALSNHSKLIHGVQGIVGTCRLDNRQHGISQQRPVADCSVSALKSG
jgi:hypothetical protein